MADETKAEELNQSSGPNAFAEEGVEPEKPMVNPSYYNAHAVDRSRSGPTIAEVEAFQRDQFDKWREGQSEVPASVAFEQAAYDVGLAQVEELQKGLPPSNGKDVVPEPKPVEKPPTETTSSSSGSSSSP